MKINGVQGCGKKMFAISLVAALTLAAVSAFSVFAAPAPGGVGSKTFESQLRAVEAARAWYNSFISNHKELMSAMKKEPNRTQYWLSQYALALSQAEAIVGRNTVATNEQQKLAGWLRTMHELQGRLTAAADNPPHPSH